MPGYVIHLATAKEYIKKHEGEINDKESFFKGSVAPDLVKDKSASHYGPTSGKTSLRKFLNENELDSDYMKGFFLHLVTDYIFFNRMTWWYSKEIHSDYDKMNKSLIRKYDVELIDDVKDKLFYEKGKLRVITKNIADNTIEEASNVSLEQIRDEILQQEYTPEWENVRKRLKLPKWNEYRCCDKDIREI